MTVYAKLAKVQAELKAPKNQYNSFGKYKYRSCEDILEAVKPICHKHQAVLVLSDDVIALNNRFYVKATATFIDIETGESVMNAAFAREEETKKGMDSSQITGTASSYARKYALNGLFNIDDTKDADTDEYTKATKQTATKAETKEETAEGWVGNNAGKTTVKSSKGQWYELEQLSHEQLNNIIHDKKYAECHNEARRIMATKALC
jgi:hypothetical protein